jgi:hypothetical protein
MVSHEYGYSGNSKASEDCFTKNKDSKMHVHEKELLKFTSNGSSRNRCSC